MNEETTDKAFFDNESLKRLIASEGKTVKKVICYFWQNSINSKDVVELIDNVEFVFTDNLKLTFSSNEDNSGLLAVEFDYEAEKSELKDTFGDKIKIIGVDASSTSMWKDVIGLQLNSVKLTKENDRYLSDSVVLDFGKEQRTIIVSHVDGLIVDFWEE